MVRAPSWSVDIGLNPGFHMVRNHVIVQFLEQEVTVAGDALLGQIYHRGAAAVGVILLHKGQRAVPHHLPETSGLNILGAVVDIVAKVDHDGNIGFQQALVLL